MAALQAPLSHKRLAEPHAVRVRPVQSAAPTCKGKTPVWEIKSERNDSAVVMLNTKAQFDHQQLAFNINTVISNITNNNHQFTSN
jgi:hypothetical protein